MTEAQQTALRNYLGDVFNSVETPLDAVDMACELTDSLGAILMVFTLEGFPEAAEAMRKTIDEHLSPEFLALRFKTDAAVH